MKVALSIWNGRISPVFDTAGRIILVELSNGREIKREEHNTRELLPPVKVMRIKSLGVDVLICGAISNPLSALFDSAGIDLVPWVSGDMEAVLDAYKRDKLLGPGFSMPGCGWRRRGRRRLGRRVRAKRTGRRFNGARTSDREVRPAGGANGDMDEEILEEE